MDYSKRFAVNIKDCRGELMDNLNARRIAKQFTNSLESPRFQPLVIAFKNIVDEALRQCRDKWIENLYQARTDFQRVCLLLRSIELSVTGTKQGVSNLGLDLIEEGVLQINGKSDEVSRRYLSYGKLAMLEEDIETGLNVLTKAVFYASSPKQLSKALGLRCQLLHELQLFDEAIEDGLMALKKKNMHVEAKSHYIEALTIFDKENTNRNLESSLKATMALGKILSPSDTNDEAQSHTPKFKCFRSKPPSVKEVEENISTDNSESPGASEFDRRNAINSKLLSAPNGILRLKDTHCAKTGYTMEVTRNVSAGDILMIEKPWAMSTWKARTKYCYYCCTRSHNLKPCSGCPHVGFCSVECQQNAKNRVELPEDGNKHIYDCQGLCPFIIHNDKCELAHLAFKCLSKVPSNELLDYICSTGSYANGKGHQAFQETDAIQRVPPTVLDPSDYSSIAFLFTGPEKRPPDFLLELTVAAVFLTYCLHLGGYPMKWFNETDAFFSEPSIVNRPDIIPASWIAACMLYHLQAAEINNFRNVETVAEEVLSTSPTFENFGISIYPTTSLINHSCDPKASVLMCDKGVMIIYALQRLSVGSEVSIKYQSYFYEKSTQERQESLRFQYYFHCSCVACRHDWNQKSLEGPEKLVCQKCGHFFTEDAEECQTCESKECLLMLKDLRNRVLPKLDQYLKKNTCTFEESKDAATSINSVQDILAKPSYTLVELQKKHYAVLSLVYANRTIENLKLERKFQ
nr:SET and MYND domain containing protein 4 [Hymenolepis microstoma]